jgi:hypothetical protein
MGGYSNMNCICIYAHAYKGDEELYSTLGREPVFSCSYSFSTQHFSPTVLLTERDPLVTCNMQGILMAAPRSSLASTKSNWCKHELKAAQKKKSIKRKRRKRSHFYLELHFHGSNSFEEIHLGESLRYKPPKELVVPREK